MNFWNFLGQTHMNIETARDAIELEQMTAETARIRAETERLTAERERLAAETSFKMQVEISKLMAETAKMERESKWHPLVIVSTAVGATTALIGVIVGIVKMLLIGN